MAWTAVTANRVDGMAVELSCHHPRRSRQETVGTGNPPVSDVLSMRRTGRIHPASWRAWDDGDQSISGGGSDTQPIGQTSGRKTDRKTPSSGPRKHPRNPLALRSEGSSNTKCQVSGPHPLGRLPRLADQACTTHERRAGATPTGAVPTRHTCVVPTRRLTPLQAEPCSLAPSVEAADGPCPGRTRPCPGRKGSISSAAPWPKGASPTAGPRAARSVHPTPFPRHILHETRSE